MKVSLHVPPSAIADRSHLALAGTSGTPVSNAWSMMALVGSASTTSPPSMASRATPLIVSSMAVPGRRELVVEIVSLSRSSAGCSRAAVGVSASSVSGSQPPSASGLPSAARPV